VQSDAQENAAPETDSAAAIKSDDSDDGEERSSD